MTLALTVPNRSQSTMMGTRHTTFLWAIYGGRVLLSGPQSGGRMIHVEWFESLGLPTTGDAFDRIPRGVIVANDKDKTLTGTVNGGEDEFVPNEVFSAIKRKYPSYKAYKSRDLAYSLLESRLGRNPAQTLPAGVGYKWAIYQGKVLIARGRDVGTHADWFEQIGLPYEGSGFDKIIRGNFHVDSGILRIGAVTGGWEHRRTFIPGEVFEEIYRRWPAARKLTVDEGYANPRRGPNPERHQFVRHKGAPKEHDAVLWVMCDREYGPCSTGQVLFTDPNQILQHSKWFEQIGLPTARDLVRGQLQILSGVLHVRAYSGPGKAVKQEFVEYDVLEAAYRKWPSLRELKVEVDPPIWSSKYDPAAGRGGAPRSVPREPTTDWRGEELPRMPSGRIIREGDNPSSPAPRAGEDAVLWAIYNHRVYLSDPVSYYGRKTRSGETLTHAEWFKELGLPSIGSGFDRVVRGIIAPREYLGKRVLHGAAYGGIGTTFERHQSVPYQVWEAAFLKWPSLRKYDVVGMAESPKKKTPTTDPFGRELPRMPSGRIIREGDNPRNPRASADEMFEAFHGYPPTRIIEVEEEIHEHEHLANLGRLVELEVKTITGYKVQIGFESDRKDSDSQMPFLAATEDGTQLYIVGGDQSLDLRSLHFDKGDMKDLMIIGQLTSVTYRTRKDWHDGEKDEEDVDYVHKVGEDSHEYPDLLYDPHSEKMLVAGGRYSIEIPGGGETSPGIED